MNRDKEIKEYLEGKLSREENMKYEIAEELGLLDKSLKMAGKVFLQRKQDGLAD